MTIGAAGVWCVRVGLGLRHWRPGVTLCHAKPAAVGALAASVGAEFRAGSLRAVWPAAFSTQGGMRQHEHRAEWMKDRACAMASVEAIPGGVVEPVFVCSGNASKEVQRFLAIIEVGESRLAAGLRAIANSSAPRINLDAFARTLKDR